MSNEKSIYDDADDDDYPILTVDLIEYGETPQHLVRLVNEDDECIDFDIVCLRNIINMLQRVEAAYDRHIRSNQESAQAWQVARLEAIDEQGNVLSTINYAQTITDEDLP